jgi:F0F1-type ATP synthase assembly protein I
MWRGMGEAWTALSTLISGIAVWGGIGYLVDRWVGTRPVLFVIGVLVGNFAGIYLIYMKYFREVPSDAP